MLSMELAMLTKAHLISHYRMFGSRWVITPLCLFRSLKPFLYSSVVYSCDLFCFCYVHTISVLIVPIYTLNIPLVSLIFLKRSLVFPTLLFSSTSLHWSLKKAFLSLLAILWNSAFKWVYLYFSPLPLASLLFTAICRASSDSHFAFLHFFFLGIGLDHCLQ